MGNFGRVFIAVILIICLFTVSVFATPTGSYDLYSTDGRIISGFTASGNTYITNFSSHLAHIQVYLSQILSYNSNISTTIDYYLPALLQRMVDAFSPASGDTRSMWQLSAAAVSGITAIQSAALGIAQDVYNISTYVDGIEGKLDTLHSDNISSNSKLDSLHSDLTFVNTNIQSLESINWIDFSNFVVKYSIDDINYYSDPTNVFNNSHTVYVKVYGVSTSNSLYYFNFPIFESLAYGYSMNVDIYYGTIHIYDNYYFYQNGQSCSILINPFFNIANNEQFAITFKFTNSNVSSNIFVRDGTTAKYITFDDTNYFNVASFIELSNSNKNTDLNDIKNILIDIDNNSDFVQNNNDLQINVDIDPSVGQGVTGVISKIQDLLDFGINLQEFLVVLNQFDNLHWFTSYDTYTTINYDPRDNLGYQDLYD